MRRILASEVEVGMIVKDWDDQPGTITSISDPFDGFVGPATESRRSRFGRVVTIVFSDGFEENVPVSDRLFIFEPGE